MSHQKAAPRLQSERQGAARPYLFTAIVITAVYGAVLALCRLYPFGNGVLASSDGVQQYLGFYAFFRDSLHKSNAFSYSFSTVLGGNVSGLFGYYLGSPLYLLFALFPERQLFLALHLVIYGKLLLAGLCFCAWAGSRGRGNLWLRVGLSVSYAFLGYNVTFYSLLSWLDAVALLPLVAMGLERLMGEGKPFLYLFLLGLTVTINYYVGFAVCLACVLMYAALVLADERGVQAALKRTLASFALASLLAGALSAWMLLPAARSTGNGRMESLLSGLRSMEVNFGIGALPEKLFTGTTSDMQFLSGLPTIFVGVLPVLLAALFFGNPGIGRRGKFLAAGALLCLAFSFQNSFLNRIWHCLTANRMFNYRYSFVFSYFLLAIAWISVLHLPELDRKSLLRSGLTLALFVAAVFWNGVALGSAATVAFDVALLLCGFFLLYGGLLRKRLAALAMALLMGLNCFVNTYLSVSGIQGSVVLAQTRYDEYTLYRDSVQQAMQGADASGSMYRMEKVERRTLCDNISFGIPGVTSFASTVEEKTLQFCEEMGLPRYTAWAAYSTDVPASVDSLLGIRYLLSEEALRGVRGDYTDRSAEPGAISLYENPYALPLLASAREIFSPEGLHSLDLQNAIWRSMTHNERDVLVDAAPVDAPQWDGAQYRSYAAQVSGEAYLQLFPQGKDFDFSLQSLTVKLWRDGWEEPISLALQDLTYSYSLGHFEEGEGFTLEFPAEERLLQQMDEMRVYSEDGQALRAAAEEIRSRPMQVTRRTGSFLTVQFETTGEMPYVVTTIPFDSGWEVLVDGTPVQPVENWGAMLAFRTEPGVHTAELRYHVPGRALGIGISLAALGAAAVWMGVKRRKKPAPSDE